MEFNFTRGIEETNNYKINKRKAVRGVIIKNNELLMIKTNKGDYKFPGGGVNSEENNFEALKREVKEESGYTVTNVIKLIGKVIDRKIDKFNENCIFEMESDYYLCEVDMIVCEQSLEEYEAKLEFKPVWVKIDEAILANDICIKNDKNRNFWVDRETKVLRTLKKVIIARD